jgi:hypothetical protein
MKQVIEINAANKVQTQESIEDTANNAPELLNKISSLNMSAKSSTLSKATSMKSLSQLQSMSSEDHNAVMSKVQGVTNQVGDEIMG